MACFICGKNENILKINSNNNTITLCQECSTQITKKLKIMKSEQEEYIANKDKFAKNFHGKNYKEWKSACYCCRWCGDSNVGLRCSKQECNCEEYPF